MLAEFKKFILKGNLVEIAVGLILALKFNDVVNSMVDHLISPLIGVVVGEPSFKELTATIGDGVFLYGMFLDTVITFLITGFVLFLIVKAYNRMKELRAEGVEEEEEVPADVAVLREIRDELRQRGTAV